MKSLNSTLIETLEPRQLLSASAHISGKTLDVVGDPQFGNYIEVDFTDATKSTIEVEVSIKNSDGTYGGNPGDIDLTFPAKGVKALYVVGGAAADTFEIGEQGLGFNINTRVDTGDGNNETLIGDQNAIVNCGAGNDTVQCGNGDDIVRGNAGDDLLSVGNGRDKVSGGDGNDTIAAGHGRDTLSGGAGNDRVSGQSLAGQGDDLFGGTGNDTLTGGMGNDSLWGGAGNDALYGNSGNDSFGVALGNDTATGTQGHDTFYTKDIHTAITTFTANTDKIVHAISRFETHDPVI